LSSPNPTHAFDECARQLYELELANSTPKDIQDLLFKRRKIKIRLTLDATKAWQYGVASQFPDLKWLEERIAAVLKACEDLQNRSLNWVPRVLESYAFSGDKPFDYEKVKKDAADNWREKICCNLVGKVQEALSKLGNLWAGIDRQAPSIEKMQLEKTVELKQPVDTKRDRRKEQKSSRPRNLPELKAVQKEIKTNKKQGISQRDSIRDYVEETYPKLETERQITAKVNALSRYLSRYRALLA